MRRPRTTGLTENRCNFVYNARREISISRALSYLGAITEPAVSHRSLHWGPGLDRAELPTFCGKGCGNQPALATYVAPDAEDAGGE